MNPPFIDIDFVIVLPHLQVRNANAVSSPLTWGFPPPSAFTGFAHALERKLRDQGHALNIAGVGVVAHRFEPQTFRPPGRYHDVFCLTRNPHDKDGNPSAIVEEGRAHLELSLILAIRADGFIDKFTQEQIASSAQHLAFGMRLAGGSITPSEANTDALLEAWPDQEDQAKTWRKLRRKLLPGFALVSREALLSEHLAALPQTTPPSTSLDALLDLCRLNMVPKPAVADGKNDAGIKVEWRNHRNHRGWLVPLPVGYAAISELHPAGTVRGARDPSIPFRFVESVLSLGEWINPLRVRSLDQVLWWHDAQPEAGLYRLRNDYAPEAAPIDMATADLAD